jgi:hypothetical protein
MTKLKVRARIATDWGIEKRIATRGTSFVTKLNGIFLCNKVHGCFSTPIPEDSQKLPGTNYVKAIL